MQNLNRFFLISLIISVLGFILLGSSCHITFDSKVSEISSLLIPFGIIGVLVERFVNNFLIPEQNAAVKTAIRTSGIASAPAVASDKTHSKLFVQRSFFLGLIIAALGFRFFNQITSTEACGNLLSTSISYQYIFDLLDIFLTAILLSGGSQLINRIVQYLADGMKGSGGTLPKP